MDPASATTLFLLFLATEKAVKYAGGKVADSMTKPVWEALEEKAKWLAGKDDTAKRWEAFVSAFEETRKQLETNGRHPELAKQVAGTLNQFDLKTLPDNQWLDELAIQLEKASFVNQKPNESLLVELFSRILPKPVTRAELSEVISDFVRYFKDALFAQAAYQDLLLKIAQWEGATYSRYDTRERYLAQVVAYNEDLDFVGIPELKDRQALQIEDVFISLQTQVDRVPELLSEDDTKKIMSSNDVEYRDKILEKYNTKKIRRLSVNQALAENSKLVILGDPGSGKTTLLKYIVIAYAENKADKLELAETKLPIFIRLYDYVAKRVEASRDGFSFLDYLYKYCTDHLQLNLPPLFFEDVLEKGDCCICFDGLDELGTAGLRREVAQAVSALRSRYPNNRFIVTSRIVGYEEAPLDKNEFFHHTIQPLSDDDIKLFVEKWYKARERDVAVRRERTEHLVKTIMGETRIKSLAANPLMLTIIALVHRIEAELPHERVKLYDKCVTALVETWDKSKRIENKTTLRRRLLEKIAYWMHSQPGEKGRTREVREGTLRTQIIHLLQSDPKNNMDEDQIQKEAENFIDLVKTRSGLLVERGEDVYTFSHLTFQEFLAACYIEKRFAHSTDAIWNEIQPKLHDAHWREVILLLLGSLNRFEEHNSVLIRNILSSEDQYEPVLHRHLLLAAQALSDRVEVDLKLHELIVDGLFSLLDKNDIWSSSLGFEALGGLQNDPRAANGLLAIAGDEKAAAGVRREAAEALGQLGRADEAVLNGLLTLAGDKKVDVRVRGAAAQVLGQLGRTDEAGRMLLAIAGDEKVDAYVRRNAAEALGQMGLTDELGRLLMDLATDEELIAELNFDIAKQLFRLKQVKESSSILQSIILNEKLSGDFRQKVILEIGEIVRENKEFQLLLSIADNNQIEMFLRRASVDALGGLGFTDESIFHGLLKIAEDESIVPYMRSEAALALGKSRYFIDKAVLNSLLRFVENEMIPTYARCNMARALGLLGYMDESAWWLLVLAGDANVDVYMRIAAAQALGQLGRVDEAGRMLLAIAGDEKADVRVRCDVAQALGQLGRANEAGRMLLAIAGYEKVDVRVRCDVAQALGQLGRTDEAGRMLLAITGDEKVEAYVRRNAAHALGQLRRADEAVLNGLLAIAGDKNVDADVRCDVAQALGQLGRTDEAGRMLLAITGDEKVEAYVRRNAAQALGQLGCADEAMLNGLLAIAGDEKVEAYVRYYSYEALKKLLG